MCGLWVCGLWVCGVGVDRPACSSRRSSRQLVFRLRAAPSPQTDCPRLESAFSSSAARRCASRERCPGMWVDMERCWSVWERGRKSGRRFVPLAPRWQKPPSGGLGDSSSRRSHGFSADVRPRPRHTHQRITTRQERHNGAAARNARFNSTTHPVFTGRRTSPEAWVSHTRWEELTSGSIDKNC